MVCKFDEPSSHGLGAFRKKKSAKGKKGDVHWKNGKSGELIPCLSKGKRWLLDSVTKLYLRDSAMFERYNRQWVL